jgi:hypothetical protein
MNRELIAYLAGIVDADGTISIKRSTYNMRVSGDARCPSFQERIAVSQVASEVPSLLQQTFGGRLGVHRGYSDNARDGLRWEATNRQAANAIRALLPYLRVKRRQAEVALALRAHKELPKMQTRCPNGSTRRMPYGGPAPKFQGKDVIVPNLGLSPEALAYRERLFTDIKALNQHGLDPTLYPAKKPRLI